MISPINLSDLQQNLAVVDGDGRPSPVFLRFINGAIKSLKNGVNSLIDVQNAVDAANAAAAAATAAAATANATAATATAAAATANSATAANAREAAIVNSYISPDSVLSASPTLVTVASHTRFYADGTSVAVSGGTVAATAPGDVDYISYSDPARAGGAVTYVAAITQPAQSGDTHVVGAVSVPTTGTSSGGVGPRKPGYVEP